MPFLNVSRGLQLPVMLAEEFLELNYTILKLLRLGDPALEESPETSVGTTKLAIGTGHYEYISSILYLFTDSLLISDPSSG